MRSIWNGAISFGLVSIPIKLVNATENHSISFRQIHTEDGGRIRYRKYCELEDREVSGQEIGKGYEDADGTIIPITDEDLAGLPIPTAKTIEIVAFVPEDRIDPLQMDAAYYLQAGGAPAAKPYTLLREALKRSKKVAITKYALRGRERLGMLRVVGDAIAMHGLLWPDEVRAPRGRAGHRRHRAGQGAGPRGRADGHPRRGRPGGPARRVPRGGGGGRRREGGRRDPPEAPAAEAGGGKVLDLMAALENSVRAARESRGEEAEVKHLQQRKTSRSSPKDTGGKKSTSTAKKKTASSPRKSTSKTSQAEKKSTTKKTAAKKTPAKKTTSRKRSA